VARELGTVGIKGKDAAQDDVLRMTEFEVEKK
jgi:hypothetical protein